MSVPGFRPNLRVAMERRASEPLATGEWRVQLHSRVLRVELAPFGGLIWNMPAAVSVRRWDAVDERLLPVRDVTRIAQIALLAAGVLGALLLRAGRRH